MIHWHKQHDLFCVCDECEPLSKTQFCYSYCKSIPLNNKCVHLKLLDLNELKRLEKNAKDKVEELNNKIIKLEDEIKGT